MHFSSSLLSLRKIAIFFIFASAVRRLHVRESSTVLDSGFHDCRIRIPGTGFQYLSVELGFWIPVVSGIPDSLSCIPVSKTQVPVVRRPISANPGLNFNPGLSFFSSKAFSRTILSILFRVANHQIVDKKN